MSKKQHDCDHLVGYLGINESDAHLIHASDGYSFDDFAAEGMKFDYCPFCGQALKWDNSEAE